VHEPALGAAERRARVVDALARVGLEEKCLGRYAHELSGGQAQRVAIARALILGPKVLVCDEAVAALDGSVRQQVLELLHNVQAATGLSILFISHDLAVVRTISHRVLVMYMGRLVEWADSATLFNAPRHPYTRALLAAVPIPDPVVPRRHAPLCGEISSRVDPPGGCVFHPRCPLAEPACESKVPRLRSLDGTHVACHLA
jgi:oligopeptide/dipeptide ABC transporter ATP-binding protein